MDTTQDITPGSAGDAEEALADLEGADPADAPPAAERLTEALTVSLEESQPAANDGGAEAGEGTS